MPPLKSLAAILLLTVSAVSTVWSDVSTTFSGSSLDPNIYLDIPNPSDATIYLDTDNGGLRFVGNNNINMWTDRASVPFAWTPKPTVTVGETWQVETQLHYNSSGGYLRIAGITLYGGPDGAGGSNAGMNFTFGLDQWDASSAVWVQGLGTNAPGDASGNLTSGELGVDSVFLRLDVTEGDALDNFAFYYKLASGDEWTNLGSFQAKFDDSRVALFLKGGADGDSTDMDVTFDSFSVTVVPEPSTCALGGLGAVFALLACRRRTAQF